MSAVKSIRLAIEVATERRDEVGRTLVRIDQRRQAALEQMRQLTGYAGDTAARWAPAAQGRPGMETVHHYYQFMERLQQAVDMQDGLVMQLLREAEAARRDLLAAELRIASLSHLLRGKLAEENCREARRDQLVMDEFAMLAHRRARAGRENEEAAS